MEEREIMVTNNLPALQATPEEWARRRQEFNKWVNTQLREGVDFGQIQGTDKPTLLKPGAEKIAQIYGCAPEFTVTEREQDANTGYMYVEVVVRLVNVQTGVVIGSGIGCCSSYESKYRWRWEWWNGRGQPSEGEGWEQTKTGKWRRRTENRDLIDQWNTVIKIAKKRAFIDAALTVSGASEKFTQDVEDFVEAEFAPTTQSQPAPRPAPTPQPSMPQPPEPQDNTTTSEKADDLHTGVPWGWRAKSFIGGALKNRHLNMTVEECMAQLYRFWQVENLAEKFGEDGYNAFTRAAIAALKTFEEEGK